MKNSISVISCVAGLLSLMMTTDIRADIRVVASIKPIHSLVSAVMDGVGTPDLIIDGVNSPHSYALRPSQAQALQNADVIFWVGPELEQFLEKAITTAGQNARSVPLISSDGLVLHTYREHHDDHAEKHDEHEKHEEHKKHDEHAKHSEHEGHDHKDKHHDEHKHEHDAEKHKKHVKGHEQEGHEGHHHDADGTDPHIWLDPLNAKVMVTAIVDALSKADPAAAVRFSENGANLVKRLDRFSGEISAQLGSVKGTKYIVFHDAYQYLEERFGMKSAGSITVNPETMPGAEHLRHIKEKVASLGATCVFSEPQFKPKLVALVTEGTKAKSSELDPLGASLEPGPELYFQLIQNMASSMRDCLSAG